MKTRLDIAITDLGLSRSREQAKAFIMAGIVYVNGQKSDKPGTGVSPDDSIEIRGDKQPYVSRGGLKLEKAISEFAVKLDGFTAMDIGASTGGFTDCMLQNGAKKVYAVDVGYGQLAWSLRQDPRVVNMERTNIRYVTDEQISEPLDFFSVDVSFISLALVLPVGYSLLKEGGQAVCLIKPQFEAGKEQVGKNGVVRSKEVHVSVVEKVYALCTGLGFSVQGLDYSPVKGPQGNIEYLIYLIKQEIPSALADIDALVERAHGNL